jgi:V/A-type H+-transporting ATPase subunit A
MHRLLEQADEIYCMMQVTGEEGVTLDHYVTHQRALLVDMVFLQQDAFDPVDVSMPLDRRQESFAFVQRFTERDYSFDDKEQTREFFTRVTNALKNLNYPEHGGGPCREFLAQVEELVGECR